VSIRVSSVCLLTCGAHGIACGAVHVGCAGLCALRSVYALALAVGGAGVPCAATPSTSGDELALSPPRIFSI
jgi:hypothetical protein